MVSKTRRFVSVWALLGVLSFCHTDVLGAPPVLHLGPLTVERLCPIEDIDYISANVTLDMTGVDYDLFQPSVGLGERDIVRSDFAKGTCYDSLTHMYCVKQDGDYFEFEYHQPINGFYTGMKMFASMWDTDYLNSVKSPEVYTYPMTANSATITVTVNNQTKQWRSNESQTFEFKDLDPNEPFNVSYMVRDNIQWAHDYKIGLKSTNEDLSTTDLNITTVLPAGTKEFEISWQAGPCGQTVLIKLLSVSAVNILSTDTFTNGDTVTVTCDLDALDLAPESPPIETVTVVTLERRPYNSVSADFSTICTVSGLALLFDRNADYLETNIPFGRDWDLKYPDKGDLTGDNKLKPDKMKITLTMKDATCTDAGLYKCSITPFFGTGASTIPRSGEQQLNVTVRATSLSREIVPDYTVPGEHEPAYKVNEIIIMTCHAYGPEDYVFNWKSHCVRRDNRDLGMQPWLVQNDITTETPQQIGDSSCGGYRYSESLKFTVTDEMQRCTVFCEFGSELVANFTYVIKDIEACVDRSRNCRNYDKNVCTQYKNWAGTYCAKTCGFCGRACVDKADDCRDYDKNVCTQYQNWAGTYCAKTCGFCGQP